MAITFGDNQYGKAEVRLVHITRDGDRHQIKDLNVSSALRGDFADAHLVGDNAKVVATDTQKNTVYAFAQQYGVGEIEEFALRLGRHFVDDFEWVTGAKVSIEEYAGTGSLWTAPSTGTPSRGPGAAPGPRTSPSTARRRGWCRA